MPCPDPSPSAQNDVRTQWQADGDGVYDIQYPDREEPNDRGKILANPDGTFSYRGILPTAYPIVSFSCSPATALRV